MPQILIAVKPTTGTKDSTLVFDSGSGELTIYELRKGEPVTISVRNKEKKHCQGWYDIAAHQNYPCEAGNLVDAKFDSCYVCRRKTDFNPGFYNSSTISAKQSAYNAKPHSVYIAYFGNELYKAGIQSDSRGLDRLFEQGALYYSIIERAKNAYEAHELEAKLIAQGLRNSVTKKQKQDSYETLYRLDDAEIEHAFRRKVHELRLTDDLQIHTNLDIFFFDNRPTEPITTIHTETISGKVRGIVGNYLVVENGNRLFGLWLRPRNPLTSPALLPWQYGHKHKHYVIPTKVSAAFA
ncbi:MAG TPA: DUF2797 domain-containing protein [Candidatus Saccharimonadales bacterium]